MVEELVDYGFKNNVKSFTGLKKQKYCKQGVYILFYSVTTFIQHVKDKEF